MKRLCIFTILAAAALTACVKENAPAPVSEIEDTVDEVISFDFSVRPMDDVTDAGAGTGTKALVSASGLLSSGNQIKVYDVFKGTTSTAEYFNTTLTSDGSGWGTEDEYKWTRTGTHNFFGWFLKDASGNNTDFTSLFGSASYSDYTLTLPAIEMTASTPQFDFLYSDVIQKNRGDGSSDPTESSISLQMKHLFTAFSLGARNEGSEKVTITKVEISGLASKKSAIISFDVANGGDTDVELTTPSDAHSTNPDFNFSGSIELTSSATKNNILSTEDSANYLMWPQTTTDLENATISVEYTQNGLNKSASFNIPQDEWKAGNLYNITTVFTDSGSIKLEMNEIIVTVNENMIVFFWDAVENATGYEIYVKDDKNNEIVPKTIIRDTYYSIENLTPNKTRKIFVIAKGDNENYLDSDQVEKEGKTNNLSKLKLQPPTISVETNNNSMTITLEANYIGNSGCYYNVKRYYWNNNNWVVDYENAQVQKNEQIVIPTYDQNTVYKIEAFTISYYPYGYDPSDTKDRIVPVKLELGEITMIERDINYLKFVWDAVSNAQRYEVSTNGGKTYSNNGTSTSYHWTGLEPGKSYTINVRAIGDGEKFLSSEDATCMEMTYSGTPEKLIMGSVSFETGTDYISVAWDEVKYATGYQIKLDNGQYNDTGKSTTYSFTGLNRNTRHTVSVRAVGDGKQVYTSDDLPLTVKTKLWTGDLTYYQLLSELTNYFSAGSKLRVTFTSDSNDANFDIRNGWNGLIVTVYLWNTYGQNQYVDVEITENLVSEIQNKGGIVFEPKNTAHIRALEILDP